MKRQRHRDHGLLLLLLVLEITNQWPRNHIKWPASLVAGPSGATVAPVRNQRPVNVPKVVNEWLDSSRKQEICLNPNFGLFRRLQHGSVWIFMEQGPKGKIGKKRRWNCLCFSSFSVTCAHVDKFWCFFFQLRKEIYAVGETNNIPQFSIYFANDQWHFLWTPGPIRKSVRIRIKFISTEAGGQSKILIVRILLMFVVVVHKCILHVLFLRIFLALSPFCSISLWTRNTQEKHL